MVKPLCVYATAIGLLTVTVAWGADRYRDVKLLPTYSPTETLVEHAGYTLSYSEKDEQAFWVAYELTGQETRGRQRRSDDFREDIAISSGSARPDDYQGTGYDRGHLAPAADMEWSKQAMSESFYMSNMSPQKPDLNRGRWKDLEEQVRQWAQENDALYIVVGPVLKEKPLGTIGKNRVTVPASYYKVIADVTGPGIKGIGFLMPNAALKNPVSSYAVSIDRVEEVTGLDFFPRLDDRIEQSVEGAVDLAAWSWPGEKRTERGERRRTGERSRERTGNTGGRAQEGATERETASETGWGRLPWWTIAAVCALILLRLLRKKRR